MEEGEPSSSFGVRRRQRSRDKGCPYKPNQKDINNLIRKMALTKSNAELLVSRLKQWDLLDNGVRITSQRKRHCDFSRFFSLQDELCYCHDVRGLFEAIGIACNINDWRLFIDSSSRSLKAVLLHNTNHQCPSIPLAHSVVMKENYQNVEAAPDALNYAQYEWNVTGDFKMAAFLMGLQGGLIKFPCFLCLWDSRNTSLHYQVKNWPLRSSYDVGIHNVKLAPLVDAKKVLFCSLHIKLDLIKQFVKKMNPEGEAFKHIQELFPSYRKQKLKAELLWVLK